MVALKVVNPGVASRAALRRFEYEAQLLGRLQHPAIAQVFEAGTFDDGSGPQPYFAMELIRGQTLTAYAEQHWLGTRERLELVSRICDGVQHAHGRGVIHRDLKPGNILVDALGQPKILDFGVARATDGDVQTATLRTDIGQLIGTIPYMSPEQAAGDPDELDSRSDVYSLGVVAYQLLAGRMPYDLQKKLIHEAVRVIREEDPAALSTVNRTLRGDVETIVGKALEKDKTRRYQSAAELAADIRRHLDDEPIRARPPSTWYQLRKFAARNRGLVGGVAMAFFVLLVGAVLSTTFAVTASRARAASDVERQTSDAALAFMIDLFEIPDPSASRGNAVTAREVLDRGVEIIEGQFADQPRVRGELLHTMGRVYVNLGLFREATPVLESAVEARESAFGGDHPDLARSLHHLGEAHHYDQKTARAAEHYRASLAMRRRLHGAAHPDIAASLDLLSRAQRDLNEFDEARRLAEQSLVMRKALLGPDHVDLSESHQTLALLAEREGRVEDAAHHYEAAIDIRRRALGNDHAQIPELLHGLGNAYNQLGNTDAAIATLERGIEISRRTFGPRHQHTARLLYVLGITLNDAGRLAEAETIYAEVLAILTEVYGERSVPVASVTQTIGTLLHERQEFDKAEDHYRRSIDVFRETDEYELANTLKNLAVTRQAQQRYDEAEQGFLESYAIYERLLGVDNRRTLRLIDYIVPLYEVWGRPHLADEWRAKRPAPAGDPEP